MVFIQWLAKFALNDCRLWERSFQPNERCRSRGTTPVAVEFLPEDNEFLLGFRRAIYFFLPVEAAFAGVVLLAAAFRRAAHRAFIICDNFRLPAAVIPPLFFGRSGSAPRGMAPLVLPSNAPIAKSMRSRSARSC